MIHSVKVTNYLGESITMELRNPEKSGFLISSIEGISPSKADVNISDMVTQDGGVFNSARVNTRNIVLEIIFYGDDIEELRQKSYKYFPIKKELTLTFYGDHRESYIKGVVEENEIDTFTDREKAQISILCPDPYFKSVAKETTVFFGIEPLFEFLTNNDWEPIPEEEGSKYSTMENPSLTEPMIEQSSVEIKTYNNVFYDGDADVGVVITIHAVGTVENVDIYNTLTREHIHIDTDKLETLTGHPLINRDTVIINTTTGNKKITLLRDGIETNILNCVNKDADWFKLVKGNNIFAFTADVGPTNLQFKVENEKLYEGA